MSAASATSTRLRASVDEGDPVAPEAAEAVALDAVAGLQHPRDQDGVDDEQHGRQRADDCQQPAPGQTRASASASSAYGSARTTTGRESAAGTRMATNARRMPVTSPTLVQPLSRASPRRRAGRGTRAVAVTPRSCQRSAGHELLLTGVRSRPRRRSPRPVRVRPCASSAARTSSSTERGWSRCSHTVAVRSASSKARDSVSTTSWSSISTASAHGRRASSGPPSVRRPAGTSLSPACQVSRRSGRSLSVGQWLGEEPDQLVDVVGRSRRRSGPTGRHTPRSGSSGRGAGEEAAPATTTAR